MEKAVLFSSDRPLDRAENIKAVWDAWDGPKQFVRYRGQASKALAAGFSVFVTDEIPHPSPHKGDTVTIFVDHGIEGTKLYGVDCSESNRAGAEQVDYAICTTEYSHARICSQLNLPVDRVLQLGMPRTDAYVGKSKGDGGTVLSEHARSYLYAPTWRAWCNPPLPEIDWLKLDGMMGDDEFLVVKRHMCTRDPLVGERQLRHVVEVGNMVPSAPYLMDCDVLATDFSSILFDGYILQKPSVLVVDGHEAYCESHGMYEPYPDWYGSRTVEAEHAEEVFLEALRAAHGTGLGKVERKCLKTAVGTCDGHSAERVAELIGRFA